MTSRPHTPYRYNSQTGNVGLANVMRIGPTSMRKPLSRPERDDRATSQTSISFVPVSAAGVAADPLRAGNPPRCTAFVL